ncbi:hypothetical protein ACKUB1_17050 [Methanospirillum stamsii]|uniref:PAS domain-containing protein n=1 Tax=Methanospirillum stamsii TaxID=1277351 RepID=A0A2V2NH25_9EURY|nr:hypothetical protein [Methanospirillum stamsii]PWR74911.1 hypothetical protein DLD82_06695 [Methanospirillum stamsii]
MKISAVDQEVILATFKQNIQGLSISDLARKSGVNRNKAAKIADDLQHAGIVNCVQHSTAKVYSLKNRSAVHGLLEMRHEPWVIIDEKLNIIEASDSFFRKYNTNSGKLLGQPISDIAYFALHLRSGDLQQIIDTKQEGEKRILGSDTESEQWMSIRVTLYEQSRAILLVLLTEQKDNLPIRDIFPPSDILEELSANLPNVIDKNLNEAITHIVKIISSKFPDDLIITLTVDEKAQIGRFNDIRFPKSASRRLTGIIPSLFTREISIPPVSIFKYKIGRPYLHEDISHFLDPMMSQEEIRIVREAFPIPTISLIGIMNQSSLIGIFGIGIQNKPLKTERYQKILDVIFRCFMVKGIVQQKDEEIKKNLLEYQDQYRKIYSELSEKTLECHSLVSETHHLMNILSTIMDQRKNPLLLTQNDGRILSTNQTALALYHMGNIPLKNEWFLQDILSPEIADRILNHIRAYEDTPEQTCSSDSIIDFHCDSPMVWHILQNKDPQTQKTYLCIGEPTPAPLIQYLTDRGL